MLPGFLLIHSAFLMPHRLPVRSVKDEIEKVIGKRHFRHGERMRHHAVSDDIQSGGERDAVDGI